MLVKTVHFLYRHKCDYFHNCSCTIFFFVISNFFQFDKACSYRNCDDHMHSTSVLLLNFESNCINLAIAHAVIPKSLSPDLILPHNNYKNYNYVLKRVKSLLMVILSESSTCSDLATLINASIFHQRGLSFSCMHTYTTQLLWYIHTMSCIRQHSLL